MQVVPKGLAGVVVSETTASKVEGEIGHLTYRGYDIRDLAAYASYEEVAYLLLHQQLPTQQELVNFRQALIEQRPVAEHFYETINAFPKTTHPLAILRTLISMLGVYDPSADDNSLEADFRKAYTLMAYTPIFTSAWARVRQNLSPIPPHADLSFAANFLYMLKGTIPTSAEISALNVYLVLMADHSLNPSTFTSRVVASTDSDIYSAITAALCALKGPKHGGANEATMQMFMEIGSPAHVEQFFKEEVKIKGRKLMGFGHRVYRTTDPRGVILREQAEALANSMGEKHWFELAARLENCALADPYFTERRLFANVDYYSSVLLTNLGIAPDLMPLVFAIGRMTGWITHILEQRAENRLIHPAGQYVGEADRAWVAIENR
jgi:citrate synthase